MISSETSVSALPHSAAEVRSRLVPIDEYGLLLGANRQVLLLNAAARQEVEENRFQVPVGFLDAAPTEHAVLAPPMAGCSSVRRMVHVFDRTIIIQLFVSAEIQRALIPWILQSEESTEKTGPWDLAIEERSSGFLVQIKDKASEVLADWAALSSWISREIGNLIHDHPNWFAVMHAGGVVYNDKCFAFPGLSHSGKSTFVASLCMAGYPYFAEDALAFVDSSLRAAAVPLAIKLREPSWPVLRNRLPGFDDLPEGEQAGVPVKFWQPPAHSIRTAPIEAIVFPHYQRAAKPEWNRLPVIETVFELLASESGPIEHTPEAWQKLIATLRKVPAFEIRYSSVEDSHRLLEVVARECQ